MARRYDQLLSLVQYVQPKTIVEVGVHHGIRAALMCREALKYRERVSYFGFDVFDTVDEEFHKEAMNGKGMPSEIAAGRRLESLGPALTWFLVKGDTRNTLHGKTDYFADIAFIDGDHRLEVIRGDYAPFASSECVVFDDYYSGETPDLDVYGSNRLVDELRTTRRVEILPTKDKCNNGAYAQLAATWIR